MSLGFEAALIGLLILANGVFALSELSIVQARKARLQEKAGRGNAGARVALSLAENPTRFLSTVQVGITLIGVLAGALGSGSLAKALAAFIAQAQPLAPYAGAIGLGVVVLVITLLNIVLGELVPKRLALTNPEGIAIAMSRPMWGLSRLASPIVRLLTWLTETVFRLFGIKTSGDEPSVTEAEISALIEQGTKEGTFAEQERDLIENVFWMSDQPVTALMTPRLEIDYLDLEDDDEEHHRKLGESPYSTFPVVDGGTENVVGIVRSKALLAQHLEGQPLDIRAAMNPPLYVPDTISVLRLLEQFRKERRHLALVLDEYGSLQGLVTLNDVLEAIVGDVAGQEHIDDSPQAIQREDGSYLVDGRYDIDELKELLEIPELPGDEEEGFHTVAGFVLAQMGHLPSPGEYFTWDRFRFEVIDLDGSRIDKILVNIETPAEG